MIVVQEMSFLGRVISLFFVFNALGQIPVFVALLAPYDLVRQKKIILRECLIALGVLLIFIFFGEQVLKLVGISRSVIGIAGGILLFLISLTLIFPAQNTTEGLPKHEPFIIPLAIPGLAGPGTMTAVMFYAAQIGPVLTAAAFFLAWIPSIIILLASSYIKNYLGEKGLLAFERLGGMLICFIGIQMVTTGIISIVKDNF